MCVTLGITGILSDCLVFGFASTFTAGGFLVLLPLLPQGATGAPEERWPTKTSSGVRANVPAKLVTCCSRCGLLSWWFMWFCY